MSPQLPSSRPRTPPPGAIRFRQTLPFPAEKDSQPHGKARWQKALLCAVVWLVVVCTAAVIHTNVAPHGKPRRSEDAACSERYGMICGGGLVAIFAFIFFRRKAKG